ncbi:MAG: hypothetical protein LBE27_05405 [Deltaproteobacteria bacterium]|jgi:hypothetical protein|nr:hypothetical protein [Deltaproteobacteria bacterium]
MQRAGIFPLLLIIGVILVSTWGGLSADTTLLEQSESVPLWDDALPVDEGIETMEPPCPALVPWPEGLKKPLSREREDLLQPFLGLPYRVDGTVSDEGYWTLWAQTERHFKTPGLNCSGFLISAARLLLRENFPLSMAKNDFFRDSGPSSPWGEDWDFGLDVALNLAGWNSPMLPAVTGPTLITNEYGRKTGLGVNIHSPDFQPLIESLKPNSIYFFAISKPDRRFASGLSYYHNGLVLVKENSANMYHATRRAGVHRLDLKNPKSLASFRANFPQVKNKGERRILFVEARPRPCRLLNPQIAPSHTTSQKPALVF